MRLTTSKAKHSGTGFCTRFGSLFLLGSQWLEERGCFLPAGGTKWVVPLVLLGAITAYCLLFCSYQLNLYHRFAYPSFDLAVFQQATWCIAHGLSPFVTVRGLHILGDHFSLILYLLAPLEWVYPHAELLLVVQTIALALGAVPVYLFAYRQLGSQAKALLFALAYLLYPAMQWANFLEFHPETLATPLLLGALYAQQIERWPLFFGLLGLCATTKEVAGLAIIPLGLYLLVRGRRKAGLATMGLGVLSLIIAFAAVRHFNEGHPSAYIYYFSRYGHTPLEVIGYFLLHPWLLVKSLYSPMTRGFFSELLSPLCFLSLLAPELCVLALPSFWVYLLAQRTGYYPLAPASIVGHYTTYGIPFIFDAAVVGYARWERWGHIWLSCTMLVGLALTTLLATQYGPFFRSARVEIYSPLPRARAEALYRLLARIPKQSSSPLPGASENRKFLSGKALFPSISAQGELLAALADRPYLYTFPNPFTHLSWGGTPQALEQQKQTSYYRWPPVSSEYRTLFTGAPVQYIVLGYARNDWPMPNDVYPLFAEGALSDPHYGLIAICQDGLVLQRGADHKAGLQRLATYTGVAIHNARDLDRAFLRWMVGQW